jgi:2-polyprenyl-3-methyl-5-hydroxy-6-metoxy-1,4-benzoquinol methylase
MKCKVCGNEKENQTYDAREMMFGHRDVFRYFQCSKCKCLQILDFPRDMSKYYPDNYYSYQPIVHQKTIKSFLFRLRDNYAVFGNGFIGKLMYARYPFEVLRCLSLIPVKKESSILDIGCGSGALLHSLCELEIKNLLGIDPFIEKDIEYENGLKIQKKRIQDVEGKWDIAMFHHSFEHIPNPAETLDTIFELLSPNGYCVIRIPTVSSYAWNHYGVNWVQMDAPRHFFLHSVESMNILANRAGLDLCKVVYDSTDFQFWASEQYIKDIPLADKRSYTGNPKNSIFSKEEISTFAKRAKEINAAEQGDQAIFYLKKS